MRHNIWHLYLLMAKYVCLRFAFEDRDLQSNLAFGLILGNCGLNLSFYFYI